MAIAIFTCVVCLTRLRFYLKNLTFLFKLTCFNTYSSTVIQTVCTLVKWIPCTIAYVISAAHSTVLRDTNQRIKKSEDYRFFELTEQIEDVKHGVVYCVVYSSVHYLGWGIAT
jgi:hypothetical protein